MDVRCLEIDFPIYLRNELLQLVHAHLIIVRLRVAKLYVAVGGFCQAGLQTQHRLRFVGGVLESEEAEQFLYVRYICIANLLRLLVFIEVIFLLSERETGLIFVEDIHRAVHRVGIDVHRPELIIHRCAERLAQLRTRADSFDFIEDFLNRCDTFCIAARGIHREVIHVAYLLRYRTFRL